MTTERDIRNQIRYAEKKGLEKGLETQIITQATGLSEEQVRAL